MSVAAWSAGAVCLAAAIDPASNPAVKPVAEGLDDNYRLVWSDEFNGTEVDETKWEYRLDSKHWSTQLARNASVSDGVCHLMLKKEAVAGKEYTGAGIISRKYFGFGYYEARIRCPAGAGWHTSFWMMDNHHTHHDTSQIELDPLETNSIDLHKFSTDYHQWRSDIGHMKRYQLVQTGADEPLDDWNVYGMEWTPEAAYFYFNGRLVRTAKDLTQQLSKAEKAAGKKPVIRKVPDVGMNDVQIWFTSIATWLGDTETVDESALPSSAQCDYVRFFAADTPMRNPEKTLSKGDVTKADFMVQQQVKYASKGWNYNPATVEKMFAEIDADGDGIASGAEKKIYWSKR